MPVDVTKQTLDSIFIFIKPSLCCFSPQIGKIIKIEQLINFQYQISNNNSLIFIIKTTRMLSYGLYQIGEQQIECNQVTHRQQEQERQIQQTGAQESGRSVYEHQKMQKEDFEAVLYRKLNYIIQLQEKEEAFRKNQKFMSGKNISKDRNSEQKQSNFDQEDKEEENSVVLYSRVLARHCSQLRREAYHRRVNAEIETQIDRLALEKRSLASEIKIFIEKLSEILNEVFLEEPSNAVENKLIEQSRKYSEFSSISKFLLEIKAFIRHNLLVKSLKGHSNSLDFLQLSLSKSPQELKMSGMKVKSIKEPIENISLYLKQFRSITISKELIQIINKLILIYEEINPSVHPLYSKLLQEIKSNQIKLDKIKREMAHKISLLKDNRIDLQILTQQNKNIVEKVYFYQGKVKDYIQQESYKLTLEYTSSQQGSNSDSYEQVAQNTTKEKCNRFYIYFFNKLTQEYQQFINRQEIKSRQIEALKDKIQFQNLLQEQLKKILNRNHVQRCTLGSQLLTHRSSYQSLDICKDSQTKREILKEQTKFIHNLQQPSLFSSKSQSNLHKKSYPIRKFDHLIMQIEKKERFIVKKMFNIGNYNHNTKQNRLKQMTSEQSKCFQLKVTKKYLILQPITHSTLILNEKIDVSKIKSYKIMKDTHSLWLNYGSSSLKVVFINKNASIFAELLKKVLKNQFKE